jgi:Ca-activated chloride channel family protein
MRWNRFSTAGLLLCLMMFAAGSAWSQCGCGLRLQSKQGPPIEAPALGTTVEVRVTGIVARAKVTQIFRNPGQEWVTGVYLFPLPDGVAVDTLRLTVGDRKMEGVVQTKEEAKQTLETAEQEGRKASLLEQVRPGLYTTSIANVGPGETVEVEIELQQVVAWDHGRFVLRFPMLAPPRYTPPVQKMVADQQETEQEIPQPQVVSASRKINPFSFHVDISPGFPLGAVTSSTHQVTVAQDKKRLRWAVDLADGIAPADGDFILEWQPAVGREPRAVYFTEEVDGEQYSLLMMMPPDDGAAVADRLPRETVFVIDTSGSMSGLALEQAKQALLQGIARLQPGDWFNVMRFSDKASALFRSSVPVGPATLDTARKYVEALQVDGGTEILNALKLALNGGRPGLVQQVIFATDGQVSNEAEILSALPLLLGNHRLFTVAIGSAPNAAFLRRAAETGRGSLTQISSLSQVAAGMAELFSRLESPMLRDIGIQWSDPAAEAWPARVPDLYLGEPLVVSARSGEAGPVSVSGLRNGSSWQDELPAPAMVKSAGLDKLWAGRKVQALMDSLQNPGTPGTPGTPASPGSPVDIGEVQREVTELGLRHHLVTNWTSLVAVDVEATAPAGVQPKRALVPLNAQRDSESDVQDVITVTAESPLLDSRRISVGATVSQTDLERIPSARDPWDVLQAAPGILTDRVNVGGNESGQQRAVALAGTSQDQNDYVVDGVILTDMAALGASPSYFDFDAFEEMQVDTGGADVTLETAGARLTTVRPRGTNEWRASVRGEGSEGNLLVGDENEARLDSLRTVDAEAGGPIVRDRLWIWGEAGRDEIGRLVLGGQEEDRLRTSGSLRVVSQIGDLTSASLSASGGDAEGSGIGAGPGRTFGTTWDESGRERLGSIDITRILTSSFFLTLTAGGSGRDHRDVPYESGDAVLDAQGIARGGWFGLGEEQRTREARLHGSVFFDLFHGSHELLFGSGWREQEETRSLDAPGRLRIAGRDFGLDEASIPEITEIWRDGESDARFATSSAWVQDVASFDRITATLGARLDRHDLGIADGPRPWTLAPRLGLIWALDDAQQTAIKASLGRFASRIGSRAAWHLDPASPALVRFLDGSSIPWTWEGIDPFNPTDPDAVDQNLRPEITDEAVLGVEHAIRPEFLVGLRTTWRRTGGLLDERRLVRDTTTGEVFAATSGDWIPAGRLTGTLPDGAAYDVPVFDLRPGLVWTGGTLLTNGDRRRDDLGFTLYWEKRLAYGWMSRGQLTWQDGDQRLGREFRLFDDPTNTLGGDDDEGLPVTMADAFRPHENPIFLGSGWSFSVSGLRRIAGGFSVAAIVNGRQGSPLPWYRLASRERAGVVPVQLTGHPDSERSPDVMTVDTRLEEEMTFGDSTVALSLEAYNLFGRRTVYGRELDLGVGRAGSAEAVLAPRTLRLGVRLGWR